ncbi:MAG: hypothetical protein E6Q97_31420 [Desulfurellales bacterium]|nr:MAG: hypothetical protein E6Q97_31420 [Desulfurellales bacterium]
MHDDDWMNPHARKSRSMADVKQGRRERPFVIQRCRRVPVSGNVAYIEEWAFWSSHATQIERDEELRKLRSAHSWTLRPASYNALGMLQVDMDEDAVLAQAEIIKAKRALGI